MTERNIVRFLDCGTSIKHTHHRLMYLVLGVVAEWSQVLAAVPWPVMVWFTLALGTYRSGLYPGCFMSSFHLHISFHLTLWVACVPLESPSAYNMYLFNLQIANHILIKIFFFNIFKCITIKMSTWSWFDAEETIVTHFGTWVLLYHQIIFCKWEKKLWSVRNVMLVCNVTQGCYITMNY